MSAALRLNAGSFVIGLHLLEVVLRIVEPSAAGRREVHRRHDEETIGGPPRG